MATQTAAVLKRIRASRVICSDETSARVAGPKMGVGFRGRGYRAARTGGEPRQEPTGARPEVWVVDLFGSRQAQVCLAHQVRDGHYATDAIFAPAMLEFPRRAVRLGRERAQLKDRTMQRHRRELLKQLRAVLELEPAQANGIRLRNPNLKVREQLLVFMSDREVPTTSNV